MLQKKSVTARVTTGYKLFNIALSRKFFFVAGVWVSLVNWNCFAFIVLYALNSRSAVRPGAACPKIRPVPPTLPPSRTTIYIYLSSARLFSNVVVECTVPRVVLLSLLCQYHRQITPFPRAVLIHIHNSPHILMASDTQLSSPARYLHIYLYLFSILFS